MKSIQVRTSSKNEFVDITESLSSFAKEEKVGDGLVLVYVPHTTAGVTINEGADPAVITDIENQLTKIAPPDDGYRHAEGNSDGHVKSTLVGTSVLVPVKNNSLALGTWQHVFFCEFDGPRSRSYLLASVK